MINLLRKEFKLSVHLTSYLFLLLATMMLIPNYPYYVVFFYQALGIFFMFLTGNTNNDIYFTALLPIRKRDAVKARLATVVIFEVLQIIVSIPFAVLRNILIPDGNAAGMDANMALFGLVFGMFGIFNIVFLPMFYKTAYKLDLPFLLSCVAMTVYAVIAEVVIHVIPGLPEVLDTTSPVYFPQQLAVLAGGIVLFGLLTAAAYSLSVKRFEQLDL